MRALGAATFLAALVLCGCPPGAPAAAAGAARVPDDPPQPAPERADDPDPSAAPGGEVPEPQGPDNENPDAPLAPSPEPAPAPLPGASPDPWIGAFEGQGLRLEVSAAAGGGYTGVITHGERAYPLEAALEAGELHGTFTSGAQRFPFSARTGEAGLEFTSAGKTRALLRVGGLAELSPRPGEDPRWGLAEFWAGATRAWSPYRHPGGFEMKLPPGWAAQEVGASLTLRTNDPALRGVGFGVGHEPVPDVSNPHDLAQLARVLDRVRLGLPRYGLRRAQEPARQANIGGRAVASARLEGVDPRSGRAVVCVCYLTRVGADRGRFLYVLSTDAELLDERGRFLARALISTFADPDDGAEEEGAAVTTVDPDAVGRWVAGGGLQSRTLSFEAQATLILRRDGVCVLGPGDRRRGQWSAAGGTLELVWSDGSRSVHDYEVLDVHAPKDNLLWLTPRRVRWRRAQ